jgi:hypothetical protein
VIQQTWKQKIMSGSFKAVRREADEEEEEMKEYGGKSK